VHAVIIIGFVADYGFEYSDEEVEEEDVDIENQYYNSKGTDLGRLQLFLWVCSTHPDLAELIVQDSLRGMTRRTPWKAFRKLWRWSQTRLSGELKCNIEGHLLFGIIKINLFYAGVLKLSSK